VAASLAPLRHSSATAFDVGLDSAIVALSGRLRLREGLSRNAESVVTELWYEVFAERPSDASGKAAAPDGAERQTP
jgi:MoxR-like ATPase